MSLDSLWGRGCLLKAAILPQHYTPHYRAGMSLDSLWGRGRLHKAGNLAADLLTQLECSEDDGVV